MNDYHVGPARLNHGDLTRRYNTTLEHLLVPADPPEVPQHDVLLTNPPYSGDHVERLLRFCRGGFGNF